jgi:hypothetical protein
VLPTLGDNGETEDLFNQHLQAADQLIEALRMHVNKPTLGTPNSKAEAAEMRNFLQVSTEAMQVIGQASGQSDPENPGGPGDPILQVTDEAGTIIDPTGVTPPQARLVRAPFPLVGPRQDPDEDVIITEPLLNGQTVTVIKETRGFVALVRPVVVPIWVEPWFRRGTIVGFRTIWIWEFVPAEFIKTISLHNNNGVVETTIEARTVLDRGLLPFWNFWS